MEYKKTVTILIGLLNRHSLGVEEKEAVLAAIGVLEWASLSQKRIKGLGRAKKAKLGKDIEI